MKRTLLLMLYVLIFVGCKERVKIEQEVEVDSYLNCTYRVQTYVWVRDWMGSSISLERWDRKYKVKECDIDSVKEAQYIKALPTYLKIKEFIDNGIDPCEEE